MNETTFWKIIEDAGAPDRCSVDEQCERIVDSLSELSKTELIAFKNFHNRLIEKSYTWPMLKACFITLSYVSDDVFEDFQNWVILNGRKRFEETIKNPDAIADYADVEDPIEEISGEPLMFVVDQAYQGDIEDLEDEIAYPKLPDIADDWPPKEGLQAEFPKLFARFWNEDRIREIHGQS